MGNARRRADTQPAFHHWYSLQGLCYVELAVAVAPDFPMDNLKLLIREVPDFPKPGILFYDITTLLKDKAGLRGVIDALCVHYRDAQVDMVLGIEARGFIFAPALAYALGAGFVPVRKPKKLPWETLRVSYDLEYGTDSLEMHKDALAQGSRVLIVDDLLATGGTAAAVARLVEQAGGKIAGLAFAIELTFLNGRARLPGYDVFSLLKYDK
jgi:adenine phosphoribosyltransferase